MKVSKPNSQLRLYLDRIGLPGLRRFEIPDDELEREKQLVRQQHPEETGNERAIARVAFRHYRDRNPQREKIIFLAWMIAILILLILLTVKSYGQINSIRIQNNGTAIANYTQSFQLNCTGGLNCSASGNLVTFNATGGGGGSGTVTNTLGALTLHAVMLGNGANDAKVIISSGTAGQVLISNGASADPSFQDPIVSGPAAEGAIPVNNPVWVAGRGADGFIHSLRMANDGTLRVDVTGTTTQPVSIATMPSTPVTGTFWQATQPVSGTVTSNQGGAPWSEDVTDRSARLLGHVTVDSAPTTAVTGTFWQATQPVSGTFWQATQPISGTVTANAGTNLNTSALALDATLGRSQGSTTAAQTGPLVQGAVTTAAPSYTTAQTSPLSLTTAGAVRVDNSAVTQPVSGTFFQATQPVSGTVTTTPPTDATTNITKIAGTAPTTVGKLDVKGADGDVFVRQTSGANLHVNVDSAPTTAVTNAGLTNIDVLLSSRTKPADQQHAIIDSGTTVVTQATGTNLHTVCDSGCAGGSDTTTTGNITSGGVDCSVGTRCVVFAIPSSASVSIQTSGTWVATVQFEATIDGTNWKPATFIPIFPQGGGVTSATANGTWVMPAGSIAQARLRASAYTSGTVVVTAIAGQKTFAVALADPKISGPDAAGAAETQGPVLQGGLDTVNSVVRPFKVGTDGTLQIALPPQPFLNITDFTDVNASSPTRGDIITAQGATPKYSRLGIGGANTLLHGGTEPAYSAVVQGDVTNGYVDISTGQTVTGLKTFTAADNTIALTVQSTTASSTRSADTEFKDNQGSPQSVKCRKEGTGFGCINNAGTPIFWARGSDGSVHTPGPLTQGDWNGGVTLVPTVPLASGNYHVTNRPTFNASPVAPTWASATNTGGALVFGNSICAVATYVGPGAFETTPGPETCAVLGTAPLNGCTSGSACTATLSAIALAGTGTTGVTFYDATGTPVPAGSQVEKAQAASPDCRNIGGASTCVIATIGAGVVPPIVNNTGVKNSSLWEPQIPVNLCAYQQFDGTDFGILLLRAMNDIVAPGGIVDATCLGPTSWSITSTIKLGEKYNKWIDLRVDKATTFTCTITNGTDCIQMGNNSSITCIGELGNTLIANGGFRLLSTAVVSSLVTQLNKAPNPGQQQSIKLHGCGFFGTSAATTSNALIDIYSLGDSTRIDANVIGECNTICLRFSAQASGQNGTVITTLYDNWIEGGGFTNSVPVSIKSVAGGGVNQAINFYGGSITNAGAAKFLVDIDGLGIAGGVANINFFGTYFEGTVSSETTLINIKDGNNIGFYGVKSNCTTCTNVINLAQSAAGLTHDIRIDNLNSSGATNTLNDTINTQLITSTTLTGYFSTVWVDGTQMPRIKRMNANYTNATTSLTDVTGLAFIVAASKNYSGYCDLFYQAASTGGLQVALTAPASPTAIRYSVKVENNVNAGGASGSANAAATKEPVTGLAVNAAATDYPAHVAFTLKNGTTAGSLQLQAASVAAATLTIEANSFCTLSETN